MKRRKPRQAPTEVAWLEPVEYNSTNPPPRRRRRWLIELIDPVERYLAAHDPRDQMPPAPPADWEPPPDDWNGVSEEDYEDAVGARMVWLQDHFGDYFTQKVHDLLERDEAVIRTTHGTDTYRIVRFWNGSAVSEHFVGLPGGQTVMAIGRSRLERRQRQDPYRYVFQMTWNVASKGPGAVPILDERSASGGP
jgi:hypothetical protein